MSATFSVGLVFFYWPAFKPKEQNDQKQHKQLFGNINDYSGYNTDQLFISSGKYKNLKDEATNSGFCSMAQLKAKLDVKAREYFTTETIKKIKSKI
eukprot:33620_1